jgi:tRNA(fMet)-specific endonuclease VapC
VIEAQPYLLDTDTASFILSGRSQAARTALRRASINHPVLISAISEGELLFGLEMKPQAAKLKAAVHELLDQLQIKPWDSSAASAYSRLRAQLQRSGKALALMDLLIASHALALGAILVSHDGAFRHIPRPHVVDWATDLPRGPRL